MKAARLVVLGVAVAAGGIAAYLAAGSKPPPPPPAAPAAPPLATVEVLVAKSDLSRGQVIENQDIGWQTWPADAANPTFIKKSDRPNAANDFTGAIVRVSMVAGDPIREPYVVMAKGSGFMAAVLPKGMRAVAVDISPESGAGGFILPDDRVDVVLTRRDKSAEKATGIEKYVSDTILRNVRVLAVDQAVEEKSDSQGRDRQDRDARIDGVASRDAGAVASAWHHFSHAAQPPQLRSVSRGWRRRQQEQSRLRQYGAFRREHGGNRTLSARRNFT